jgi:D-amino-acid dehydrogenase
MKEAVIIGGGIIGMWCAWHLQEAGVQVSIVDKGDFLDGCSYGNAGMVVPSHFVPLASPGMMAKGIKWMFSKDSPFYIRPRMNFELAQWLWLFYLSSTKKHVAESASLLKDMHTESRELYRQLQSSGFDFKFEQKGILMLFRTAEAEQDELEMATAAHQLGIQANFLTQEQLAIMQPRIRMDVKGAVHYPGDCHFTPHLLMNQMKAHLQTVGVEFLEKHEVANIEDHGKNGCTLSCKNGITFRQNK